MIVVTHYLSMTAQVDLPEQSPLSMCERHEIDIENYQLLISFIIVGQSSNQTTEYLMYQHNHSNPESIYSLSIGDHYFEIIFWNYLTKQL